MEGEQPTVEQTITSTEQPTTTELSNPQEAPAQQTTEIQMASTEEKPATDGANKLENTPENQEQSKYK